jgi:hypothetical protein
MVRAVVPRVIEIVLRQVVDVLLRGVAVVNVVVFDGVVSRPVLRYGSDGTPARGSAAGGGIDASDP